MERRVVITGLGAVSPIGNNVKELWESIKSSRSGIGNITKFDTADYTSKVAGEIRDFSPENYLDKREARRMDSFTLYGMVAALEGMDDAGLKIGEYDPERIGIILGNGIGGIETLTTAFKRLYNKGPMTIHPLTVPKMISNIAPANIAIKIQALGPNYTVVSACSSGTDAIGQAYRWIRSGESDIMVAGGSEAAITPIGVAGFCILQALSTKFNDIPDKACRPFDKDRDGFVIAEGAGILIIEELEHAKKRGAKIYAELGGEGITSDAYHLTAPHPEGKGAVRAMELAIKKSGLKPEDIDYINAHGTSTPINDPTETKAIKAVFGDHAKELKVSSTKSMTGHLLGAAGGLEAVITALAIKNQYFPPTINLENPDPECDLNYVPNKGYEGTIKAAISNSFGFGGHNSVMLLKKYE